MTKERELLRRALEELKDVIIEDLHDCGLPDEIRAYLAAEEGKREEEPVAWWYSPTSKTVSGVETSHHTIQLCIPSTQAEQRKALSEEEIVKGYWEATATLTSTLSVLSFEAGVRFAEKHHGIGGKDE